MIDTGDGIPHDDLEDLFTTFSNDKISVFKSSGIGVGLTTAKELTQALCGGIMLES